MDVKHHVYLLTMALSLRFLWDVKQHFNKNHGQSESRRDQEEGGELDSHEEDSFAGPGEIKRREVSWTLTKKLDSHLRVEARKKR